MSWEQNKGLFLREGQGLEGQQEAPWAVGKDAGQQVALGGPGGKQKQRPWMWELELLLLFPAEQNW